MKRLSFLLLVFICGTASTQTKRQIQNIEAFNRLYGYVRYFHPSDEASAIDWDHFAVYGSEKVLNCNSDVELQKALEELFLPLGPTIRIVNSKSKEKFDKKVLYPADTTKYKTISWQHRGLGGEPTNVYQSERTNRRSMPLPAFGTVTMSVDASAFQGSPFKLRGKVRLISGSGSGQLWARVDKKDKSRGFFDNMGDRPVKSSEWNEVEVSGTIDQGADQLFFGAMLVGKGYVEVDDLELSIKQGNAWETIRRCDFESDKIGESPEGMWSTSRGYKIQVSSTDSPAKTRLVSFRDIDGNENTLFKKRPHVGEVVRKELGPTLSAYVPLALFGNSSNTYPASDTTKLNSLNRALALTKKDIDSRPAEHLSARLGGLVIAWNVFQHFYPYFDVVKVDWSSAFRESVTRTFNDKTSHDYLLTLQEFTAKLKDGHIFVSGDYRVDEDDHMPPVGWEWVEEQLVVTKVIDETAGLKIGDVVTLVDGVLSRKHIENSAKYVSAATRGRLQYRVNQTSLSGPKNSKITVQVQSADKAVRYVTMERTLTFGEYWQKSEDTGLDPVTIVKPGIYYVNLDKATMEQIEGVLPELAKASVLICDLRGYPNNNHQLIQHLLSSRDTSSQWMRIPNIIYPDQENVAGWSSSGWKLGTKLPHISAKTFFLLDATAISYAESFMGFIEHYDLATIIGQPSAGTNGNVNKIKMPFGYTISWTGMKVVKHDGSQLHGVGILPDVYVSKTIKGIREGRDEFLEKALELAAEYQQKKN